MERESGEEAKDNPQGSSILVKRRLLFWPLPVSESLLGSCLHLCLGLLSLRFWGKNRTISSPWGISSGSSLKPCGVVDRFHHLDEGSGRAAGFLLLLILLGLRRAWD